MGGETETEIAREGGMEGGERVRESEGERETQREGGGGCRSCARERGCT